jgi:hypothetical protein
MTFYRNAPAASDSAAAESETAEVHEIYPGSRQGPPVQSSPRARRSARGWQKRHGPEAGMATAEYAIATLAAVGFAGLLVLIMRSDEVRGFLLNLIRTALALP